MILYTVFLVGCFSYCRVIADRMLDHNDKHYFDFVINGVNFSMFDSFS